MGDAVDPEFFDDLFAESKIMVILRGLGPARTLAVATSAWDAGATAIEVPVQHPDDLESLGIVARAAADRGLIVGAGTVVDPEQVLLARRAGARFTVSPGVDEEVIRASQSAGLATLPGVATPSDIQRARRVYPFRWMKAFPASVLGVEWFRAMAGPFPGLRFVATGGIGPNNAQDYIAAGAAVISLGSAITEPASLATIRELGAPAGPPVI
jgi:2-dehydro-3-deoxyphosphogluconate aldolase / (4S)-4-hydroxy-2-oxoglutarate aldolase